MTHRRRNPMLVVDEVEWLLKTYSPDMMWVADDVFTIHHGWLREYAARNETTSGSAYSVRVHLARGPVEREMADLLGGTWMLPRLDRVGEWVATNSRRNGARSPGGAGPTAVEICRSRGIQSGMFLMWGYEGEELSDIEATIDHVKRVQSGVFFTTVAYPIKGTPYYQRGPGPTRATAALVAQFRPGA